jgi:hypothetical protein
VDAADYVVWRKKNGAQENYYVWRANFGMASPSGSISMASVPEPATAVILTLATAPVSWMAHRTYSLALFASRR